MADLLIITAALIPIFVLILLGAGLNRSGFPGDSFWPQAERLTYYILFPALLVGSLATADVDTANIMPVALAVLATMAVISVVLLALRGVLPVDGPGFTSVFQGSIRFNTYVGLAIAFGVYGVEGGAVAALVIALMIPVVNVLSVMVLGHFAGGVTSPSALFRSTAKNPLILACLVGIILNGSGIGLPWGSAEILEIVGRAALPLGLMTVGAGLRLKAARGQTTVTSFAVLTKLVVMPLMAWGTAWLMGLSLLETQILVIFYGLPTASASYILARQMGGDHTLVATLLTAQTAFSAVTLPLWLFVLG